VPSPDDRTAEWRSGLLDGLTAVFFVLIAAIGVHGDSRPGRTTDMRFAPHGEPVVGVPLPATLHADRFSRPMPVPPVLAPTAIEGGVTVYDLRAQSGTTEFFPGKFTPTLGYNGSLLGPTIRVRRGQPLAVRIEHAIPRAAYPRPTNIHWHGVRMSADADGPHHDISLGEHFTARFTVEQPAATFWYHPHSGLAGRQVYMGLAGFFLVDDEVSDALPLPRQYGVDDFPMIVQDRQFDRNAGLTYTWREHIEGMAMRVLGDQFLVNGVINPYLDIPQGTVRLRLLNGSDTRRYCFAFEDGRAFNIIASDGGLLPAPVRVDRLELAPAERAEILVDFSHDPIGARPMLISRDFPIADDENGPFLSPYHILVNGKRSPVVSPVSLGRRFPLVQLRVARAGATLPLPDRLASITRIPESAAEATRDFELERTGENTINGKLFEPSRIDVRLRPGAIEIWRVTNFDPGFSHTFHLHGMQFQVLDRTIAGKRVDLEPTETGWKDTVIVHPDETVRIINDFSGLSGHYMFHCHMLSHEDLGMMGSFFVGEETPSDASAPSHAHAERK
jgi:blue copper oxidase